MVHVDQEIYLIDVVNLPTDSPARMERRRMSSSNGAVPRTSWTAGCDWRERRVVDAPKLDGDVLLNGLQTDGHWLVAV